MNTMEVKDVIYKRYFETEDMFETFTCATGNTINCYAENIIIGCPIVKDVELMFAKDLDDWYYNEAGKTIWMPTGINNIAELLVLLGIVKSKSEVRRNKPELCKHFDKPDYVEVKWGKRRLYVLIGQNLSSEG